MKMEIFVKLTAKSQQECVLLARAYNLVHPDPKSECVTRPDLTVGEADYEKIRHLLTAARTSRRTEG